MEKRLREVLALISPPLPALPDVVRERSECAAHVLSSLGPSAGSWLNVLPSSNTTSMSDIVMRAALRLYLDLPTRLLTHTLPFTCICGKVLSGELFDRHIAGCRSVDHHPRHDLMVRHILPSLTREVMLSAKMEPRGIFGDKKGPDLDIYWPSGNVIYDFTSVLVKSIGISAPAAKTRMFAALQREEHKDRKYADLVKDWSHGTKRFRALVIESGGAFSQGLIDLTAQLGARATEIEDLLPPDLRSHRHWLAPTYTMCAAQRISFAYWSGIAQTVCRAADLCRHGDTAGAHGPDPGSAAFNQHQAQLAAARRATTTAGIDS